MFFPIGLIFLVVFLLLIGIGIAIGLGIAFVGAVAIGLGVISTSVAFGFLRRKPSSGLRAFFYQMSILGFSCAGLLIAWLLSVFLDLSFSWISIVTIGLISGVSIGVVFGALHSWMLDVIAGFLFRTFCTAAPSLQLEPEERTAIRNLD